MLGGVSRVLEKVSQALFIPTNMTMFDEITSWQNSVKLKKETHYKQIELYIK